jgi:hypothetical protein
MNMKTEGVKNTKIKNNPAKIGQKPVVKSAQKRTPVALKPAVTAKSPAKPSTRKTAVKGPPHDEGSSYTINSTVACSDANTTQGLTVIAYDNEVSGENDLGKAVVKSGRFEINYRDTDFRKTTKERGGADVVVCVFNGKEELLFTSHKKNYAPVKFELNIPLPAVRFVVPVNADYATVCG